MTSNEILREALIKTAPEYFSKYDLAENEKPHRFSLAFYVRKLSVERLAAKAEKTAPQNLPPHRYMPIRKLSIIIALIFAAVFLTAAAWVAYISVYGFVFEAHSTHSDVSVDFSMYTIKDTIEEVYRLPVESGCEFVYEIVDSDIVISEYVHENKEITLIQYTKVFAGNIMMNTDDAEVCETDVNGNAGFIILNHGNDEKGSTSIMWIQDEYVLYISGISLEKEELIMLAESVNAKEVNENDS